MSPRPTAQIYIFCLAPVIVIEFAIPEPQIAQVNIITKYLTLLQLGKQIDKYFLSSLP